MKYEIKIISEEDTVKSKPYEDLDKAIEIADKMFNDFVNTDFGDEIVVADDLQNKTYWANGKLIYRPLQIGDVVKIKNSGQTYSTYKEFMVANATKELCCDWNKGVTPRNFEENNKLYTIEALGMHNNGYTQVAVIKEKDSYGLCVYMVGTEGLELLCC